MSLLHPTPALCSAIDPASQSRLEHLHRRMEAFYNSATMRTYFATAETVNDTWGPELKPQWHLRGLLAPGASVLDLGCGSAHVCRHWADRGLRYTGVDWSRQQVDVNRSRYPEAQFTAGSYFSATSKAPFVRSSV
jgi:2-polyprenyl-3-methyl-5-hydroxy-6-metoxy-1,4-benzoquinol methylase